MHSTPPISGALQGSINGPHQTSNIRHVGDESLQHPLIPAQELLLANCTFLLWCPDIPYLGYVTVIEQVYQTLNSQDAEELQVEVNTVLKCSHPQNKGKSKQAEENALQQIKRTKKDYIASRQDDSCGSYGQKVLL